MTEEAEELSSEVEKSERLRSLFIEIRQKAKDEHNKLKGNPRPTESRYALCMIGILEECDFGKSLLAECKGPGCKVAPNS